MFGTNNNIQTITIYRLRQQNNNIANGGGGETGPASSASDCPWYRKPLDWLREQLFEHSGSYTIGEESTYAVGVIAKAGEHISNNPTSFATTASSYNLDPLNAGKRNKELEGMYHDLGDPGKIGEMIDRNARIQEMNRDRGIPSR